LATQLTAGGSRRRWRHEPGARNPCKNGVSWGLSPWGFGGTPTIWAFWTKTGSFIEQPVTTTGAESGVAVIPAGLYSGVLADGSGSFLLMLDEWHEDVSRTAYLYVAFEGGVFEAECMVEESDGDLILATEDGETFVVDPAAGVAVRQ